MPSGTVIMVACRAAGQNAAAFISPVRAVFQHPVNQPFRLVPPGIFAGLCCQLLQSAGCDRAGNVVNPFIFRRLAEVTVRKAVLPDMRREIPGDSLRRFRILFFPQVPPGQGKSIQAPCLSPAPLAAQGITLPGVLPDSFSAFRVKFDDMAYRSVFPQEFPQGCIGMDSGRQPEPRILCVPAGAV